jgi:hypothetical protein
MSFRWFGSAIKKAELIATVQLRLRLSVPARFFMGPTMHLIVKCAILFLFIQSASMLQRRLWIARLNSTQAQPTAGIIEVWWEYGLGRPYEP